MDHSFLFLEDGTNESEKEEQKGPKSYEAEIPTKIYLKLIGKVVEITYMVDIVCKNDKDLRLKLQANLESHFNFCYDVVDERQKKQKQSTITSFFKKQ